MRQVYKIQISVIPGGKINSALLKPKCTTDFLELSSFGELHHTCKNIWRIFSLERIPGEPPAHPHPDGILPPNLNVGEKKTLSRTARFLGPPAFWNSPLSGTARFQQMALFSTNGPDVYKWAPAFYKWPRFKGVISKK